MAPRSKPRAGTRREVFLGDRERKAVEVFRKRFEAAENVRPSKKEALRLIVLAGLRAEGLIPDG